MRGDQFDLGGIDIGLDLQLTRCAIGSAEHPTRSGEIAVAGDHAQFRPGPDQFGSGGEIVDHGDTGGECGDGAAHVARSVDHVGQPARTAGQHIVGRDRRGIGIEDKCGATAIGLLQRPHRGMRGISGISGDGVGERAEGRGDRGLETTVHTDQSGKRTEQALRAILDQPGRAVPARQAHTQCFDAGAQRCDPLAGVAILFAQFRDALIGQFESLHRMLVLGVQTGLTGLEFTEFTLARIEFGLGGLAAPTCLADRDGEPGDLGVHRLGSGAQGVDLTGQPGQSLATVGDGTHRSQMRLFGRLRGLLTFGECLARGLQGFGRDFDRLAQFGFLGLHPLGLGLELFRIPSAADGQFGVQVAGSVARDSNGGIDPLGQRGQLEPDLRGGLGARRQPGQLELLLC